jgi:hypothetical protein
MITGMTYYDYHNYHDYIMTQVTPVTVTVTVTVITARDDFCQWRTGTVTQDPADQLELEVLTRTC